MNGILNVYFNSTIYTAICLKTFEDEELNKNGKRKREKRYREEGVWDSMATFSGSFRYTPSLWKEAVCSCISLFSIFRRIVLSNKKKSTFL